MKAIAYVLEEYNQPLVRREIEVPPLSRGQVLVKLLASGICGSDVHMLKGEDPRLRLPMILGHEGVGIIADLNGPRYSVDGEELHEGDFIIWNRGVSCGGCYYCTILHEPSLCPERKVPGINLTLNEAPYLNGCYADHLILNERIDILKITQKVDPGVLVAASCSGATAAHGFDMVHPEPGDTVIVIGPGPLGLFAVALAKAYGASKVILTGGSESRLKLGEEFGAAMVLNRKVLNFAERKARIMELTGGRGGDLIIEASGTTAGLQEGIALARKGGTVLNVGMSQPAGTFPLDGFEDLTRKNLRLQGVWVSDTSHLYRAVNLVLKQVDLFAKLVTHRFGLSEVNQALQVMDRKEAVKAVLLPGN